MSEKESDKSRPILSGIAKSFVGLPYSFVHTVEEQGVAVRVRGNKLIGSQSAIIERQGDRSQAAAHQALIEMQSIRSATESGARALEGTRWEAMEANRRLERIHGALEDGLPAIAEEMAGVRAMTEQVVGVPAKSRNIDDITASDGGIESEAIILAIGGGLKADQRKRLFENLVPWKRDIIESGLISRNDPKMERTLSPPEKVFLAGLRRKAGSGIMSFGSIETLARHRILDEDLHFELSKIVRVARTGLVGVVHGLTELAEQGDTKIAQGATLVRQGTRGIEQREVLTELQRAGLLIGKASLDEQRGIRTGVDSLVDFERLAQIDRRAIRESSAATAENTFAIARGVAAQIHLAQKADQHLGRISEASEGTYRNTALLTVFAERANEIGEANLSANVATARGVGHLVEIGEASLGFQDAIARNSAITATNTASIAVDTRELVGFSERAEYVRALMVQQNDERNALLGDIADGIDTGNYYQALTREAIADTHLTLIQGFSTVATIAVAQLETAISANDLLSTLVEIHLNSHEELRKILQNLESGMEQRHLSANRARAQERFQEGLGKYRKGKVEEAIALFDNSIDHWSNDHRVYFYRGICYVLSDKPEDAEEDLKEALIWGEDAKDPRVTAIIRMNLARLYYSEAKVYQESGNSDLADEKMLAAVLTAKEASEGAPDFYEADFALAIYLAAFKLYDEAREILMRIIPKEPTLAVKMLYVEEFAPILDSFKHTLEEDVTESDSDTINRVSIAMIKDCIEIGEFTTAIACMRELIKTGAIYLLRLRIWEIEELMPIRTQIIELIITALDEIDPSVPQNCYAVAILALSFRINPSEISDFKIFDVFIKGTENDPDAMAKNKIAMSKKLRALSEDKLSDLLAINKLHRKGLEWLN